MTDTDKPEVTDSDRAKALDLIAGLEQRMGTCLSDAYWFTAQIALALAEHRLRGRNEMEAEWADTWINEGDKARIAELDQELEKSAQTAGAANAKVKKLEAENARLRNDVKWGKHNLKAERERQIEDDKRHATARMLGIEPQIAEDPTP